MMADYITAESLRESMHSHLAWLHYNDQYNGCHAGVYDFLLDGLSDEITDDDGSSGAAMDGILVEQLPQGSAPVAEEVVLSPCP